MKLFVIFVLSISFLSACQTSATQWKNLQKSSVQNKKNLTQCRFEAGSENIYINQREAAVDKCMMDKGYKLRY